MNQVSPMKNDEENARRLAKCTQEYSSLKEIKIRREHDVERLSNEYKQACAEALEKFGTDDLAKLREAVTKGWRANTDAVDAFEASIAEINTRLQQVSSATQEMGTTMPGPSVIRNPLGGQRLSRPGTIT